MARPDDERWVLSHYRTSQPHRSRSLLMVVAPAR
ncbi:MAG: hypothetical protein AVDCRST_MAG10-1739 [uncultured Acidimicrobiales bacterium]|uniref:Uncharacterized protein n=1 Tax=uncultured Acidimicrobiales bacterium TaxID=310071 RepID=A0A6J4I2T7_9ACTN|nr:MAG: hypothetical protein AVDCRST_MAG10-1739 [uncultured Acidimicrobiales bacterium]